MNIITTTAQLNDLLEHYSRVDAFAFDVESTGSHRGDPRQNIVSWLSMATYDRVDVIPMGHPNGEYLRTEYPLLPSAQARLTKGLELRPSDYSKDERKATRIFGPAPEHLTRAEVFGTLKPLFTSDKMKVGHNLKFDLQSITKYLGQLPAQPYACTLNASFILDNQVRNSLGLDDCLDREFGYKMVKGVGAAVEQHSFDEVATYSALDAEWTWKLWVKLSDRLDKDGLRGIFNLEMDVLEVICNMELRGADIDVSELENLKTSLEAQLEDTKANIYRLAGRAFNINSVPEKQRILFTPKKDGGRGLRPKVMTPAGQKRAEEGLSPSVVDFSVAEPALQAFAGKDALVDALLEYSDLNKLMTTYVMPYLGGTITRTLLGKAKSVDKKSLLLNGRIHTDFVQYGAETGRFSSRNPNLQNIPNSRTANGKAIRNLFTAPEGYSLVVADYSQIEPRVLASFSQDRVLCTTYMEGADIYTTIGNTVGVDRAAAKTLVLAMMYGVGPDKVADTIGMTVNEARQLLDDFLAKFPAIARYKRQVIAESKRHSPVPFASTLLKRRRYLPDLRASELWKRSRAERQAFNTVIQGSAADLMKLAMIRAHKLIPEGANLILTVHDELVTVTPDHIADETAEQIRVAMEGINALRIPLLADVKVVSRWGEAK